MKALRIKALALHFGYAEHLQVSTLLVHWRGRPFTDAREAIDSFVAACRAAITPPAPKRKPCCTATLAAKPSAKACPDCGVSFVSKRKTVELDCYLDGLRAMDCDSATDHLYPHGNAPAEVENGESHVGGWEFFKGFPADCDVVEVDGIDQPFREYGRGAADYCVIHVGKAAIRASSRGRIEPDTSDA